MNDLIRRSEAKIIAKPKFLDGAESEYNKGWNDAITQYVSNINSIASEDQYGQWISVKEKLPEKDQTVIIQSNYNGQTKVTIGYWDGCFFRWYDYQENWKSKRIGGDAICPGNEYVDAWMPLPGKHMNEKQIINRCKKDVLSVANEIKALALINIKDIFQFTISARDKEIISRYGSEEDAIMVAEKYLEIATKASMIQQSIPHRTNKGWEMTYTQPIKNSDERTKKTAIFYNTKGESDE